MPSKRKNKNILNTTYWIPEFSTWGRTAFVPRVAACDWSFTWLTGNSSKSPQATSRPRSWRGNIKPHRFFLLHPACKYYFVALCIDNVNLDLMLRTARLDVCEPCSTLTSAESLLTCGWSVCTDMNWSAEMLSIGPKLRLLLLLSCVTIILLFHGTDAKKDLKSACSTCRQITDNFNKVRGRFLTSLFCFCLAIFIYNVSPAALNVTLNAAKYLNAICDSQTLSCVLLGKEWRLFCVSGLWQNSKAELWRRKHSLGGEETL